MMTNVVLVGVELPRVNDFAESMVELHGLAEAADLNVTHVLTQKRERVHAGTYLGKGKLAELQGYLEGTESEAIIVNDELTPSQIKNLEAVLECEIMDRTMLILAIFAERAQTREAKLQVEVARLQYLMPRLAGMGISMSRQGGGSSGLANRGAGETKLELDRRTISDKINQYQRELKVVANERDNQRRSRQKKGLRVAALVGYTNAGKSSIMNTLVSSYHPQTTEKQVLEKDMLFATLDTSVRRIHPKYHQPFLLTDTVGFVDKLPTQLVKAFRSTLEEVVQADVLIHVIDASSPDSEKRQRVTEETLKAIGAEDKPMIYVWNKADLVPEVSQIMPKNHLWVSTYTGKGISELMSAIEAELFADEEQHVWLVPYDRGDVVALMNEEARIIELEYVEEGTQITAITPQHFIRNYGEFIVK
ncbi:GTPase HflX [Brochothrix thermosphacta]|uniref:GTPase HflX n=2 Tax=Brochothrix thermosphacta TaxID=2756 RepID=UPI00083F704B|nr:GTPase HflX [Brochothrix thermosphacta]ANZ96827.1 GTPase HflX [Brochothrix thermosphacta]ODJ56659.1 GTPase HflX [Brochothrix thermosphacta]ODJ63728.1 GTPase HflX [Brochothrix thermosphacta]ODJ66760.1 GTPase HflX [Brochothrix thermosphacta]ODJ69873.1 GTPase HflX [Brochothrix thermosphacta]